MNATEQEGKARKRSACSPSAIGMTRLEKTLKAQTGWDDKSINSVGLQSGGRFRAEKLAFPEKD